MPIDDLTALGQKMREARKNPTVKQMAKQTVKSIKS